MNSGFSWDIKSIRRLSSWRADDDKNGATESLLFSGLHCKLIILKENFPVLWQTLAGPLQAITMYSLGQPPTSFIVSAL